MSSQSNLGNITNNFSTFDVIYKKGLSASHYSQFMYILILYNICFTLSSKWSNLNKQCHNLHILLYRQPWHIVPCHISLHHVRHMLHPVHMSHVLGCIMNVMHTKILSIWVHMVMLVHGTCHVCIYIYFTGEMWYMSTRKCNKNLS